jgi:outer membrane protein TolC
MAEMKTKTLQAVVLAAFLLAAGWSPAQGPAPSSSPGSSATTGDRPVGEAKGNLSLADAVALALRRNVDLRVESLNSSLSREDVKRSRAIYDPFLTANGSGGGTTLADRSGMNRSGNASVGVTQLLSSGASVNASTRTGFVTGFEHQPGTPLYDYSSSVNVFVTQPVLKNAGRRITEVNIVLAKSALQDSLDRYRLFAADTVLSVITSYNRLYALRETLAYRKTSLDAAQKLLETTRANTRAAAIDVTNADFGVAQRLRDVVDAERTARDQEAGLRYLIGMTTPEEIVPTDPPTREEPQASTEQAVKTALDLRPDLRQLRSALASNELLTWAAKDQTLPDVSLFVGAGRDGSNGTLGDNLAQMRGGQGFWSAGVNFSMPLGNTAAESDYRKGKIRTVQAKSQIQALSWRIRNDVESDMRALISARLQIQVAGRALEQATGRLEEYRRSNQAGTATTQNVLDAEADLSAARSSRVDALEAYAAAVTRLWRDTGELLDHMGVKIDTLHPENWKGEEEG